MVTKDRFWEFMCEDLNYRFFSGVVCKGFDDLYKRMPVSKMHYIPAVNERTAIYLCKGVMLAGIKSAVFMGSNSLFRVPEVYEGFLDDFKQSLLLFVFIERSTEFKLIPSYLPYIKLTSRSKVGRIGKFLDNITSATENGIVFIDKGFLV